MSGHTFIFSTDPTIRLIRHVLFWLAWWVFFYSSYYSFLGLQDPVFTIIPWNPSMVAKSGLILTTHMLTCYITLAWLLPLFLNARWFVLGTGALLVATAITWLGYYIHLNFFPLVDSLFDSRRLIDPEDLYWQNLNSGLLNGLKVIAAAVCIKLLKRWWQKQEEMEGIERERIEMQIKLLKMQIHPRFLFNTLNSIYRLTLVGSSRASEVLLRLSDLLSYLLYDCDHAEVELSNEIKMVSEYLELERCRYKNRLILRVEVQGEPEGKRIAPFLLLPFVENSVNQCSQCRDAFPWINLDINIGENHLEMKLTNVIPTKRVNNQLSIVKSHLEQLFQSRYELKIRTIGKLQVVRLVVPVSVLDRHEEPLAEHMLKPNLV